MGVTVRVPASFREYLGGHDSTVCDGKTVGECIDHIDKKFSGFKEKILDEENEISTSILMFLDGENIKNLKGFSTPVIDGSEISIIPFAAGG